MNKNMDIPALDRLIRLALEEDLPHGDITTDNLIPPESITRGILVAKEKGIIAGLPVAERVFKIVDSSITFSSLVPEGSQVNAHLHIAEIKGPSRAILKGVRTALNFLQRLSGIATHTHQFVKAVDGTKTQILDTRKTTPGLRMLEKYAVRQGGGTNHRFSLSDMVLIKDNHLQIVGSIRRAVQQVRRHIGNQVKVEVEVTSLAEAQEALEAGADWIMLDNMSLEEMRPVVEDIKGQAILEASGNITIERAREIASIGIDYISVGRLTHSVKALDISLEFSEAS